MQQNYIMPPPLRTGDLVAIVSPASAIDTSLLDGAQRTLHSWGLRTTLMPHTACAHGTFAGSQAQRLADLQSAIDNPEVRAIICSRGGYGAVHLLEKLCLAPLIRQPKWLVGFSDITALHCCWQNAGLASVHGPMARDLALAPDSDNCTMLRAILFGNMPTCSVPANPLNRHGVAMGTLRGGNFAVMSGLNGTPFGVAGDNIILFIEDVGEKPHRVERMMYNLRLSGMFDRLAGLIIGEFTDFDDDNSIGKPLYEALSDIVSCYRFPVCFGFPIGHGVRNLPLISGGRAMLSVSDAVTLSMQSTS